MPTVAWNVETLQRSGQVELTCWDFGGRDDTSRAVWLQCIENTHGLVWVFDSTDHARFDSSKDELLRALKEEELQYIPLLILCNKQDLPNAMSVEAITSRLELSRERQWHIFGCCGITGAGLNEAFDWLSAAAVKEILRPKKQKQVGNRSSIWAEVENSPALSMVQMGSSSRKSRSAAEVVTEFHNSSSLSDSKFV